MTCLGAWLSRCIRAVESECDVGVSDPAPPEVMRTWALLSHLVCQVIACLPGPPRFARAGCVFPPDPEPDAVENESFLSTSKSRGSRSQSESIKVTLTPHFFSFSGDAMLIGKNHRLGRDPEPIRRGFWKANQYGPRTGSNGQEMGNGLPSKLFCKVSGNKFP